MASRETKRWQNICSNCGDTWYPRGRDISNRCPNCGNRDVHFVGTGCTTNVVIYSLVIVGCICISVVLLFNLLKIFGSGLSSNPITTILIIVLPVICIGIKIFINRNSKSKQIIIEINQDKLQEEILTIRKNYLLNKFNDQDIVQRILECSVEIGDSKEFVLEALGKPVDINKNIIEAREQEIWKYKKGNETKSDQHDFQVNFENDQVVSLEDKGQSYNSLERNESY